MIATKNGRKKSSVPHQRTEKRAQKSPQHRRLKTSTNFSMILSSNTIHCTPAVEHLLPFSQLNCSVANCNAVFTNAGNLDMHLQKHHKIISAAVENSTGTKQFYCPDPSCVYNVLRVGGKHFKCLKYLRQHYQKVHASKNHVCSKCGKHFATLGLLKSHEVNACGKKFKCVQCGWEFEQREALMMHGKRKGHAVHGNSNSGKVSIARTIVKRSKNSPSSQQEQETQTEETLSKKRLKVAVAQTDDIIYSQPDSITSSVANATTYASSSANTAAVDFESLLCDIETQTEIPYTVDNNVTLLDQMLSHSSNMHTQTCDDFLNELGLADIQTQTNWTSLDSEPQSAAERIADSHDDLFVSTETQTSFTQCLLEGGSDSAFGSLCNTQHTQTCETLLEGLFGAQESDFMGTFHSTYTQT